ncbi:MAG: Y-family DNA polymerase [Bacteroidales bacterium]|nr:Y-family DNA polymerase [Bacteroidales bacterium]
MILHIDCNTFYASCEVALRPDLQGKPVAVANCNEAGGGIILALTKEAKALGLKRGDPVFKVQDILNLHNVAVFPANLQKYVDISRRLMQVVREQGLVLNFKQYSVDEFFGELPLTDVSELRETAATIKRHIEQCTGVPVSCGVSLSYTLGKVATWYAKHYKGYNGVCVLPADKIETALAKLPIEDVWGIGRQSAAKLQCHNIRTALNLYNMQEYEVRRMLHINGVRTWLELHGTPSVDIDAPVKQKSISHSRTFTYMTDSLETLRSYIAEYSVAAARKLRDQHSVCLSVSVFLSTNRFRDDLEQYGNYATTKLNVASADTSILTTAALKALKEIYRPHFQYKKAGVILSDITTDEAIQLDLFESNPEHMRKSERLMAVIDELTTKYGMDTIKLGVQTLQHPQPNLTNFQPLKNQTTNINDIIEVK